MEKKEKIEDKEKRTRIIIGAVCLLAGGALGVGGMVLRGRDVEERTRTIIETETKYVYKTIYKENEKKEEKKEERKDVERERIVERRIVVPCKCQQCKSEGSFAAPSGMGILKGEVLGFELPEGYYVIEERIGEKERDKSGVVEERREEKEIRQNERIEHEDKNNYIYQSNRIEKSKEMNWMVGVKIEYGFGEKELNYGVGIRRRIIGPVFVGVSGGMDRKANVQVGGDVSIGF